MIEKSLSEETSHSAIRLELGLNLKGLRLHLRHSKGSLRMMTLHHTDISRDSHRLRGGDLGHVIIVVIVLVLMAAPS